MTDDDFLHAIVTNPDDDAPRLVYADWLEECGNVERAEFIRVECELTRVELASKRWRELSARQLGLIRAHKAEWTKPLKKIVSSTFFRRGFVETVSISPEKFATYAKQLFQLEPVQEVRFNRIYAGNSRSSAELIAASAELLRVRTLSFDRTILEDVGLETLVRSQHLGSVRMLILSHSFLTSASVRSLVNSQTLTNLTGLNLEANQFSDADVRDLLASSLTRRLEMLDLSSNPIQDVSLERLAKCVHMQNLKILRLGHYYRGLLTDAGLSALAASSCMQSLVDLSLERQRISDEGICCIARGKAMKQLRALNLAKCERPGRNTVVTDRGIRDLAEHLGLEELRSLNLENNQVTDAGAAAFAASATPGKLAHLNLKGNPISKGMQKRLRDRFGKGVCTFSR